MDTGADGDGKTEQMVEKTGSSLGWSLSVKNLENRLDPKHQSFAQLRKQSMPRFCVAKQNVPDAQVCMTVDKINNTRREGLLITISRKSEKNPQGGGQCDLQRATGDHRDPRHR
ncbi:hypothetical protein HHI36_017320 [Cryptolaemus montrouzieri]|uniref:Uncharacterized protein n=1 Tax=Cryptolaemus montrouzieri TaxID=559131 RepID=A0ABD2NMZ8_9CUCU